MVPEILNFNFEALGQITEYNYMRWYRKFLTVGSFEMQCVCNENNKKLAKINNLVARLDAVEVGLIEKIEYQFSVEQGNIIIVSGRFLSCILDRRIALGTQNFSGRTESIMRQLITENFINPTDSNRKWLSLVLGADKAFQDNREFQVSYKPLQDIFDKLVLMSNISFNIYADFDLCKFVFQPYTGRDLKDYIILSEEEDSLYNSNYLFDSQHDKNYAIVGGEGEEDVRIYTNVDNGLTGFDRREVFIDASSIRKDKLTISKYTEMLKEHGTEQLKTMQIYSKFDSVFEPAGFLEYKKDWDLGDIVSVTKKDWDIQIEERVTEIEEIYSVGEIKINPTFGTPLPEVKNLFKED